MSNATRASSTPASALPDVSDPQAPRPTTRSLARRAILPLAAIVLAQAGMNLLPLVIEIPPVGWAGRWFEWSLFLSMAVSTTIVAWMLLAPQALKLRIAVAAVALLVIFGTQWSSMLVVGGYATQGDFISQLVALITGYFVAVAFVAWYFRRVRGWRLVPRSWNEPIPAGRPLRFNLRHVFIATAVAGLILAVRSDRVPYQLLIVGVIAGFVASVFFVPVLTLILGVRPARMMTLLDVALLSIALIGLAVRVGWNGWTYDFVIFATCYAWACVGIVWLRLWEMRLVSAHENAAGA